MKEKLKILFVIPYFAPAWGGGGPAKLAYDYAKELVKKGQEMTVYTSDVLYSKERIKKKHDYLGKIEVFYLPNLSNFLACRRIYLPTGFPKLLRRTIKNFDIVHCFDFRTFQNIYVSKYAKKEKIPYFLSVFGQTNKGNDIRSLLKVIYDWFWGRKILDNASRILAQNNHEENDLKKFGVKKSKISLLPLSIDFSEFKVLPKKGDFRKKLNILQDDFVILFVGRLHYFKGIDILIKSLPLIKKHLAKVKLVIVGRDDGYLHSLKKLVQDLRLFEKVIFTGPVYAQERINTYVDSDIFAITPRYFEETSLASLEAAACGIPIIINNKCQVPYLDKYNAGLSLEKSTPREFTKALFTIFKKRAIIGKNARRMIQEKFSLERITNDLEQIYFKIERDRKKLKYSSIK